MSTSRTDRDALTEIGNIIGAPTMCYFGAVEIKEWRERGDRIAKIVQEQLGIRTPAVDSEKYRRNPSLK